VPAARGAERYVVIPHSFLAAIEDEIDNSYARDFTVQPLGTTLEQGGEQVVPA